MPSPKAQKKLINAITYFLSNTNHCYKTKLMKLLFLLDFDHFKETCRSVTELDYYAWPKGPVPSDVWYQLTHIDQASDEMKKSFSIYKNADEEKITIKSKVTFNPDVFSERELDILKRIAFVYQDVTGTQISEISHLPNMPWDKTLKAKKPGSKIDYSLALDDTSVSIKPAECAERTSEQAQIAKFLREI